jgi:hypothetical protein
MVLAYTFLPLFSGLALVPIEQMRQVSSCFQIDSRRSPRFITW